jgi:hypothetical protein
MRIKSYFVNKLPPRSWAIWANDADENRSFPIAYLRKPLWLTEDQWLAVVAAIRLEARADLLEEEER